MKKILITLLDILFLLPLSKLWEFVYYLRRLFYRFSIFESHDFKVPIISIGNVVFGGTGKTPFTLWVTDYLSKTKKTMILTRGYKGKLESDHGILHNDSMVGYNPENYGDEALVFARRLKNASIVVGKNRVKNLEHYYRTELPDVVILDDGHQHLKLNRDLNFVLFDSLMDIEKYQTAPRGYLREGMTSLSDADAIVFSRSDVAGKEKIDKLKDMISDYLVRETPFVEFGYKATNILNSNFEVISDVSYLSGKKIIALSGIASPDYFFSMIESAGGQIIKKSTFPDHHNFVNSEIIELITLAKKEDAILLTTEKDIVKIRRIVSDERILFLEIGLQFFAGEHIVKELIDSTL
jgi:tetraacyldisaccharide 4'-kinase